MGTVILWLEDRPASVGEVAAFCQKRDLEVELVSTALEFYEVVRELKDEIGLIIVDIMLYRVMNLENLGLENTPTDGGHDAGWVVIERLLRPEDEPRPYAGIPILIVSSRPLATEENDRLVELNKRAETHKDPPVRYLEKGGLNPEGTRTWDEAFKTVIQEIFF